MISHRFSVRKSLCCNRGKRARERNAFLRLDLLVGMLRGPLSQGALRFNNQLQPGWDPLVQARHRQPFGLETWSPCIDLSSPGIAKSSGWMPALSGKDRK